MGEGFHRLLRKQIQRARGPDGSIDYDRLLADVSAAYDEADLDRRRTDRAALLMCEEMEELHESLRQQALHDPLTGLANRTLFRQRLHEAARSARDHGFALLTFDLDRFKAVNDTLGHPAGDQLLVQVAARLREQVRASDTPARLGGDEFGLLLKPIRVVADACQVADRIVRTLSAPFDLGGMTVAVGASVGVVAHLQAGDCDPEAMLERADRALYRVKGEGRSGWRLGEAG